ncbi:A-type inclusion protein [Eptesipox virus]|uniref:A-type inclusion protein n=1 Tax=Eptesipox virus TaxID=1329402 RepID=A0A220T6J0_9POXV|nr:A-type inclusion protein [Eptesipox virus]ASK51323.1 A-type inclusion protein [Eptesipox virus]WAH71081.1 A-type inclusion protein [Eptesipox virus]
MEDLFSITCDLHMNAFIEEVEKLWSSSLNNTSSLSRKSKNVIRNLFREVTNSNISSSCYDILLKKQLHGDSINAVYRSLYGSGSDIDKRVDTVGKYILFVVVTYLAILIDDKDSKEIVSILTKFVNVISNIHSKYKCKYMFVGIPAIILFNKLDSTDVQKLYSLFSTKLNTNVELYEEYFNFIVSSDTYFNKKKFVKFSYGPVSFASSISVPDFVMEGLTFRSCDRIEKSEDIDDVYVFITVESDPKTYAFSKLTKPLYEGGLVVETDDLDDATALVIFDAITTFDKFRNKALLLTLESIVNKQVIDPTLNIDRYPTDENISDDTGENVITPIKVGSSIGIVDYRLVINKLTEWLNQCEEKCEGAVSPEVKELRERITDLEKQLDEATSGKTNCEYEKTKIKDLESRLDSERQRVTRLLDDLQKARDGKCDSDSNDKAIIEELRKEIQNEQNRRMELMKELDKVRNGDGTSSCERELDLTRQWLHERDNELREMSKQAKHFERELERERIKNKQCDKYKKELDEAKSKIIRLETDLDKCLSQQNGSSDEVRKLTSQIESLERDLRECRASSGGDEKLLADIDLLKQQIGILAQQLEQCETRGDEKLLAEIEFLKEHINSLAQQLEQCEASGGSGGSDTSKLQERITYLENELDKYIKGEGNVNFTLLNEINRLRDKNAELQNQLDQAQSQDKNNSYYKRALERERAKIIELENELQKCFDNNSGSEYIIKMEQMERKIKSLEAELRLCKDTDHDTEKIYKDKIAELQRELDKCKQSGGSSNSHTEIKVFYDVECRTESARLQQRINELNDELNRLRKEDKTDSYYKREVDRQRKKVIELEHELEKYFNDDKIITYKKEMDAMQVVISEMRQELEKCKRDASCSSSSDCSFEQKRIELLELELRKTKEMVKQLEKFIEFSSAQKEYADKLEREKIARLDAEHALERERARKDCGGNMCEQELELERNKNKKLELYLETEKDKANFYKRELEKERFIKSSSQEE